MATLADMHSQLEEQSRVLRESVQALPEVYREVQAEAVAEAYRDIVETSPVRTGAYRAEHVIEQGDGDVILYESPNRPGPDAIVVYPTFIDAPTVAGRVESVDDYATVQIANRRFYAAALEYGNSTTSPRHIYEGAALRARVALERLVEAVSRRVIR